MFGVQTQTEVTEVILRSSNTEINLIDTTSNYLVSLALYTSIFQPLMRLSLVISDPNDIIKNMKMVGGEDIEVTMRKSSNESFKTIKFRLNSMVNDNVRNSFDKKNTIILDCVSPEYLSGSFVISKRFSGKGSDIIDTILKNNIGSTKVYNGFVGKFAYNIQSNYKNSFDVISYIAKNDNAYFYEDFDGFYYKRFTDLGTDTLNESFDFLVNQKDYQSQDAVKAYKIQHFNNEILLGKGSVNTNFINLDTTNYKINKSTKKSSEVTKELVIGNQPFFPHLEERKSKVSNIYGRVENRLKRYQENMNLQSHILDVKVNGNLSRRIGQKVYVNFRGHDNSLLDYDLYKGYWVIVAIKNDISPGNFDQDIQLAKINFEKV